MLPQIPTAFLAACLTLGSQDPFGQSAPQAPAQQSPDEATAQTKEPPSELDLAVAHALAEARGPRASSSASLARQLAALGEAAAPALLDAYVAEHVVVDPQRPELDLQLTESERQALAATVT